MNRGATFVLGIVAGIVLVALGALIGIETGTLIPANADGKPPAMEKWAASASLHATMARVPQNVPLPPVDDAHLTSGIKLYAANCAVCHGTADGKMTDIAAGQYQRPPQFAKHGVDDDPEYETYWKIQHGIRLTAMPAYGGTLSPEQIGDITIFLKHLPELQGAAKTAWEQMQVETPTVAPASSPAQGQSVSAR